MEVGGESFLIAGIDVDARNEALDLVRQAADPQELLDAARTHFDEKILTFDAVHLLARLNDAQLDERLKTTAFDPTLFKAVTLFELSHVEDESDLPMHLQNFADFWQGSDRTDQQVEELAESLVAETQRSVYRPFASMSLMVILGIVHASTLAARDRLIAMQADEPPRDPLQEEIDGKSFKVFFGDQEYTPEEHPVLTSQLRRDLRAFMPGPIIDELLHRFPPNGTFEEVHPLIERIKSERAQAIIPSADELMARFVEQGGDATWLGREEHESYTAQDVVAHFIENYRDVDSRTIMQEVYVREEGRWYTLNHIESDVHCNTFYRRIFYGDETTSDPIEVPLDAREAILATLARLDQEDEQQFGPKKYAVHDIFGPFDPKLERP